MYPAGPHDAGGSQEKFWSPFCSSSTLLQCGTPPSPSLPLISSCLAWAGAAGLWPSLALSLMATRAWSSSSVPAGQPGDVLCPQPGLARGCHVGLVPIPAPQAGFMHSPASAPTSSCSRAPELLHATT